MAIRPRGQLAELLIGRAQCLTEQRLDDLLASALDQQRVQLLRRTLERTATFVDAARRELPDEGFVDAARRELPDEGP